MTQLIRHTGGVFATLHKAMMGTSINFEELSPGDFDATLLEEARTVWLGRVHSEFRSVQIMNRFLGEILGAGDPLEVYAGAADMVTDEIRHTALCVGVCEALGIKPVFPDPIQAEEPEDFLRLPFPQRSLATAISMLAINETLSTGFITDLRDRCTQPVIRAVLDATLEDEDGHHDFGWSYLWNSLKRFQGSGKAYWREVTRRTLAPHREKADEILRGTPTDQQNLENFPDEERVQLGLFSPQRQALIFRNTYREDVAPKLLELELI